MIDLRSGVALHARAGCREDYLPVCGNIGRGGDPLGLALAFLETLGLREIYVADLDAIEGGEPDFPFLRSLAEAGILTWVDAGIKTAAEGKKLRDAGVSAIFTATETLPGSDSIAEIVGAGFLEQLVFSLDLRDGNAIVAPESKWPSTEPISLISKAYFLGIRRFLLLETTRMGTGLGSGNHRLIQEIGNRYPNAEVIIGGGVSGIEEIRMLMALGVSRVLVGSALHDGRIDKSALDSLERDRQEFNRRV